jgi:hypothetical protein
MFSLNDKVNIMWGDTRISFSDGVIDKVTPKFIHLNQGAIRSIWIPRHLIRHAYINGVGFGNPNQAEYK